MLAKRFQKLYQAGDRKYKAYEFGFKPTMQPQRLFDPYGWVAYAGIREQYV
jgi:hypothetical protein